jgi:hypothetical protein
MFHTMDTLMNKLEKSVVEKAYIAEDESYVAAGTVIIRVQLLNDGAIRYPRLSPKFITMWLPHKL